MPGRSLLLAGPAYIKIPAEIPIKILEARGQCQLDWSWTLRTNLKAIHHHISWDEPTDLSDQISVLFSSALPSNRCFSFSSQFTYSSLFSDGSLCPSEITYSLVVFLPSSLDSGLISRPYQYCDFPQSLKSPDPTVLPNSYFICWIWSLEKALRWKDGWEEETGWGAEGLKLETSARES